MSRRRNELARQWADDLMEIQGLDPESLRQTVREFRRDKGICGACGTYLTDCECGQDPRLEEE